MFAQDDDSFFGADAKTSTRFDRNFSITDFLKINLGTEVALPLVSGPDSTAALEQYLAGGSCAGMCDVVCGFVFRTPFVYWFRSFTRDAPSA